MRYTLLPTALCFRYESNASINGTISFSTNDSQSDLCFERHQWSFSGVWGELLFFSQRVKCKTTVDSVVFCFWCQKQLFSNISICSQRFTEKWFKKPEKLRNVYFSSAKEERGGLSPSAAKLPQLCWSLLVRRDLRSWNNKGVLSSYVLWYTKSFFSPLPSFYSMSATFLCTKNDVLHLVTETGFCLN